MNLGALPISLDDLGLQALEEAVQQAWREQAWGLRGRHLLWGLKVAQGLMPDNLRQQFYHGSHQGVRYPLPVSYEVKAALALANSLAMGRPAGLEEVLCSLLCMDPEARAVLEEAVGKDTARAMHRAAAVRVLGERTVERLERLAGVEGGGRGIL
jgi:hypothetical protein